jgi:GEVED domain/Secretion system C-terminal sorting domain
MKKIYSFLLCTLFLTIAKAQFPAPYCAEDYSAGVEPITSVVFGGINNASSDAIGGTPHEDYTAIVENVTQGVSYSITLKGNSDGTTFTNYYRVFVDWDQNGDFLGAGESYNIGTITGSTGLDAKSVSAMINVPITALIGNTRMRITKKYNSYQNSCNTAGYGESEDYTLNVIAATGCAGKPVAGTANSLDSTVCSDLSFDLTLLGSSTSTGLTYQWQSKIGAASWMDIAGATSVPLSTSQSSGIIMYRCIVTCTTSSLKDTSMARTISIKTVGCPPTNDEACTAITLLLDSAAKCGNTTLATSISDPTLACSAANNTVWYKYTPTTTGIFNLKFTIPATGGLNGWLAVYTATGTCPSLTFTNETLATLGSTCGTFATGTTTTIVATLDAGIEYYFMLDGVGGASGAYCVALVSPPLPPTVCSNLLLPANNAIDVAKTPITLKWSTVALATQYDVYLGITNPPTTLITTSTIDSFVYTGAAYSTQYYWYVAPKNLGGIVAGCDAGAFTFTTMASPPPPINDDVCGAITLLLDSAAKCDNTTLATSVGDPTLACSSANNTVWYKYTPTTTGVFNLVFTTPATGGLNGWLAVYTSTGTCPTLTFTNETLATLGTTCGTFSTGTTTTIAATLDAGTEYYFMLDGVGGAFGAYCVALVTPPLPPVTCAVMTMPVNMATNVATPQSTLKWTPVAMATAYDVYLGTSNPPTTLKGTATSDSLNATGLLINTLYYWYVVPKNSGGAATGCDATVFEFTTDAGPLPPSNDSCLFARNITDSGTLNATTFGATQSMPAELCASFTGNANDDVWFSFTATQNGTAIVTVIPQALSAFDAVIIAYTGANCDSLVNATCRDASFSNGTEILNWPGIVAGQKYYFRVYGYGGVGSEANFTVSVKGGVLPVALTSFVGKKEGNVNLLNWVTKNETNNKSFELQRSIDGKEFATLATIASKAAYGNSSATLQYQYTDNKPLLDNNYYRLKQIDFNGNFTYSSIVVVKGDKIASLKVTDCYPNPANRDVNLIVTSPIEDKITLVVTDVTGKVLQRNQTGLLAGNNKVKLDVSTLNSGMYFIKILCSKACEVGTVKFFKQ